MTVTEPSGKVTEYEYDDAGNRLTELVTLSGVSTLTVYTVNDQNRLQKTQRQVVPAGKWSTDTNIDPNLDTLIERFTYDDSGNVLARMPEKYFDAGIVYPFGGGSSGDNGSIFASVFGDSRIDEDELTPSIYVYNDKTSSLKCAAKKTYSTRLIRRTTELQRQSMTSQRIIRTSMTKLYERATQSEHYHTTFMAQT